MCLDLGPVQSESTHATRIRSTGAVLRQTHACLCDTEREPGTSGLGRRCGRRDWQSKRVGLLALRRASAQALPAIVESKRPNSVPLRC